MSDTNSAPQTGTGRTALSRAARRRILVAVMVLADSVAILAATMTATLIRFGSLTAPVSLEGTDIHIAFWQVAVLVVPLWVAILAISGLYDLDRIAFGSQDVGKVIRALSLGVVALIMAAFFAKTPGLSRGWTLYAWVLSIVFVVVARVVVSVVLTLVRARGHAAQRVLVVGSNAESEDIVRVLRRNAGAGLTPVGCVASSYADRLELDYCSTELPIVGAARDILSIVEQQRADAVIIAASAFDHDVVGRIVAELRTTDVDVHISSGLFEVLTSRVLVREVAGVPLITVKGLSLSKGNLLVKRSFDLLVAGLIVAVGLPLWLLIAAAIKLTSTGPVFYGQTRVGRDGKPFAMLKFRSMYQDADARLAELATANEASGPLFKMRDDPRVTSVGKWLRRLSFDEFPQLINVLRGEMSLVGPRPPLPHEVERYSARDWRRLEVVPGMTGLWQVSGRSSLTFDEMVSLDLFYIENWSVGLDMTLLVRTVPAVLSARGAY